MTDQMIQCLTPGCNDNRLPSVTRLSRNDIRTWSVSDVTAGIFMVFVVTSWLWLRQSLVCDSSYNPKNYVHLFIWGSNSVMEKSCPKQIFLYRRVCKISIIGFVMCVCLSVRPSVEQLGSHWTDYYETWYLSIFRKSFEAFRVPLRYDKNNGYYTWRPTYIYDHFWLNSNKLLTLLLKYIHTIKVTCFSYKKPLSGL
jgi:hypothetical protein